MKRSFGHAIRGALRVLFLGLAAGFGLVVTLALVLLAWPQLIINSNNLKYLPGLARSAGYRVGWTAAEVHLTNRSLLHKALELRFEGICVRNLPPPTPSRGDAPGDAIDACFRQVVLAVDGGLIRFKPRLVSVGPVELLGGEGRVNLDLLAHRAGPSNPRVTSGDTGLRESQAGLCPAVFHSKPSSGGPMDIRERVPGFVRNSRIGPVSLQLTRAEVITGGQAIRGLVGFDESDSRSEGARATLMASARTAMPLGGETGESRLRVDVGMSNPGGLWDWNRWTIDGKALADLANSQRVETTLRLRPHFGSEAGVAVTQTRVKPGLRPGSPDKEKGALAAARLDYDIKVLASRLPSSGDPIARGRLRAGIMPPSLSTVRPAPLPRQRVEAEARGTLSAEAMTSRLDVTAYDLTPQFSYLWVRDCTLSLARPRDDERAGQLAISCPAGGKVPVPPRDLGVLELPTDVSVKVTASLRSSDFIPSAKSRLKGDLTLTLDPLLTPMFQGGGSASAKLDGRMDEFPKRGSAALDLALRMEIPDFQKLVAQLNHTAWSVPAPLRVMEGSVALGLNGKADLTQGFFPLRFETRLSSKSQTLDLDAKSSVEISGLNDPAKTAQLQVALVLSDVKIELPRLPDPRKRQFEALPRFNPDPRIMPLELAKHQMETDAERKAEAAAKPPAIVVNYTATIRTADEHPVQLVTNLVNVPIPVNLNLSKTTNGPLTGTVDVAQFPLEFFRQKATIDHLDLTLQDPIESSSVDGLIRVPYDGYTILLQIVGSVGKPSIVLSSDPPATQQQILALLLFGQEPDDLSEDQGQSVGGAQAALSAGAVNLLSLYFLASTPIQSINYDPASNSVTARFQLASGTTVNVGGGVEQGGPTVGIRHRLGRNFYISSGMEYTTVDPTQGPSQAQRNVTATLEWSHRY